MVNNISEFKCVINVSDFPINMSSDEEIVGACRLLDLDAEEVELLDPWRYKKRFKLVCYSNERW